MRLALAANLMTNDSEEQAEYDPPETINFILENIKFLGHEIELINLTRPLPEVFADFIKYQPELIFNIAEGTKGRFREAFWPSIFDELKVPYTGSDPYSLMLTLDKNLTKQILKNTNVLMPQGLLALPNSIPDFSNFQFPVIIKPNFEGSSKGITQNSIIENPKDLADKLNEALKKYPEGVLVEEYIDGKDITVPYLENLADPVLDAIEYIIDIEGIKDRRYKIYDYDLKTLYYDNVSVEVAKIPEEIKNKLKEATKQIIKNVGCKDLGRLDFRLTDDGQIYFLEINCLPSLDQGVGFFVSAKNKGLQYPDVFNHIIKSALQRNLKQNEIKTA